jgi:hypothetical protein
MDERTFEVILSRYSQGLLPHGWVLEGQQIGLGGGILDLLFRDGDGVRHLVELKKGTATLLAIDQVLQYAEVLREAGGGACVPWVVAHSIPAAVARTAAERGVSTLAISASACEKALELQGVLLADIVPLRRRTGTSLSGGAGDVWAAVDNEAAFAEMPSGMSELMVSLCARPEFSLNSGKIQTIIRYRGVKLGGVNRKNQPHGYLTSGVLVAEAERKRVAGLGFRWMEKHQSGSRHVHTWFQIAISEHAAFARGLEIVQFAVDRSLGDTSTGEPQFNAAVQSSVPAANQAQGTVRSNQPPDTPTVRPNHSATREPQAAPLESADLEAQEERSAPAAAMALAAVGEGRCRCRIRSGRHYVLWVALEHLVRSGIAEWRTVLTQAQQRLRRDHEQSFDPNYMDIDWFRGWLDDGAPKEGAYWEGRDAPPVGTRVERRPERLVLPGVRATSDALSMAASGPSAPVNVQRPDNPRTCKHGLPTARCGYCSRRGGSLA